MQLGRWLGFVLLFGFSTLAYACGSDSSGSGAPASTGGTTSVGGSAGFDSGTGGAAGAAAGSGGTSGSDAGPSADAADANDAAPVSCDDKAKPCVADFGSLFTKSNGRADGSL